MNKSLLMLLAVATMGSNLMVGCGCCEKKTTKTDKNGYFCDWGRCDGEKLKKCDDKKVKTEKKEKKSSCWSCCKKEKTTNKPL